MSKIDPRLKYLQTQKDALSLRALESVGRFGLETENVPSPRVRVLVQFSGDLADLQKKGLEITSAAGDVITGFIDLDKVDTLADVETVLCIESSRALSRELDASVPDIRANMVHAGSPGYLGDGVIIGIIDTGVDWQHQSVRRTDGTSRILRIWDQSLTPKNTEHRPDGFNYGVEYTRADIDAAIASQNPTQVVRHRDSYGHGTHVTGIAAGDGSVAGNGQPAFTFVGVAPEADIIVVANRVTTKALGDSASTLDAIVYILNQAATLKRPIVINMSLGDNLGPHDGTSLLERGIDNLLGDQGLAFVKSAGNEGRDDRHAAGAVIAGKTEQILFNVPTNCDNPVTIDIWYAGADRLAFSITPPGDNASAIVNPGNTMTLNLPNGNAVFVDSVLNDPNNQDNRIYVQLLRGTASNIQAGNWTIDLIGITVINGRFHAWIERGVRVPQFLAQHAINECTISIPGTARKVITVASYITKGTGVGSISSFSSRGPTRDGRAAPTIAAPGESIMSARAQGIESGSDQYLMRSGTSMAAPHVTGVIALMLQVNSGLTQVQIRNCLTRTARNDAFTGATPNTIWGAGKIDAQEASKAALNSLGLRVHLAHIFNTGINLAWAQTFTQYNHPAPQIRTALEGARAHAGAALIFVNPEANINLAISRLDSFGVGQQTLGAIVACLFSLQGQLRDFHCYDAQSRKAFLPHIYNTAVNLAWAQVLSQHLATPSDIRENLERALAHAEAALIFDRPQLILAPAIKSLTPDSIWNAIVEFQHQLEKSCYKSVSS